MDFKLKQLPDKVNEIKALFIIAQRVIPFMEELFSFIDETTPLLEEINNTIKDNLKKMPNASKQLSKVTQATEMASTEIMDTVDRVNNGLFSVIDQLKESQKLQEEFLLNPIHLLQTTADAIVDNKELHPLAEEIYQFIDRTKNVKNNEHQNIINKLIGNVQSISDDANTIINSLQVQDITAQQLAAVNHLLENVQNRLSGIMAHINESDQNNLPDVDEQIKISKLHRNIAFDPDAIDAITPGTNRQSDVDKLLANPDLIGLDDDSYSQNTSTTNDFKMKSPSNPIAVTNDDDMTEEFSQDDIDALFGGG